MKERTQDRFIVSILAIFCLALVAAIPGGITALTTYDSVFDMAQYANPLLLKSAHTRGYYYPGDGGAADYYATNTVTSTNIGSRIKATVGSGSWSWDLRDKTKMNVAQWGFKGDDSTDNSTALTALINGLGTGVEVIWLNGTYRFNSTPTITKSNWVFKAASPRQAILKFTPATKQGTGAVMQGDGWTIDGLEIDWQQNAAQGLYCNNYHNGWTIKNSYIHGAYANDVNDPSQTTEVANVAVRRGNYDWTIENSNLGGADCAAAGTRTSAGLTVTDFNASWTSADNTYNGMIRRCRFDSIGPGGFGDAIRFNMTTNYDAHTKVIDCHFGNSGFRQIKLIATGVLVRGNTLENTDTNARCAIEDFGDNNLIEDNSIVGTYAYGIAGGSSLGATVRNGRYANNHIRFTGASKTTGIGFRISGNMGNAVFIGNSVTDASYGLYADGKFYGNLIDAFSMTNIVNNGIEFTTDGSNAPDKCQVNNVVAMGVGNYAVRFSAGTSLDCGMITGPSAGLEVSYASGVTGKLTPKAYGDGLWRDWNGVPMVGSGWIWDECLNGTYLINASSTANSGTASLSGNVFDANHNGAYSVGTASSTNAVGTLRNGGAQILFGSRTIRACAVVKTPTALSSATDKYEIFVGFGDATTGANTDGAFFDYTHDLNSGNWSAKTCSASSFTTATSGSNVAVTGGAYWWLGIEANSTNAKFYVAADSNGAPGTWTLIGASSSNLPTSGTTGFITQIIKQAGSTGTTTETLVLDKFGYQP